MNGPLKTDTLHAGRYLILTQIGEGGFGTVYKASDRSQHGKIVAIKEINMAALSTQQKIEVTDSFNREITLLTALKHKSLPRIFDQFTDPEHWYIVMDYIEGQTLEDLLARSPKGRLSIQQAVKIGVALCDVLSYLHDQDPAIIFRDIKPSNIMLTPWGHLYLIDFGIARRYRHGQLRDTGPLGSPGYAAPEQYGRAQTSAQTDIYGLGATMQTLLTGREPLEIRTQGIPSDVRMPWKLQALIMQMLDPNPSRRPESMVKVKASLSPHLITWRPLTFTVYFAFMGINQTRFIESPFWLPYLLVALVLVLGYCAYATIRAWRTGPSRLSAKAVVLIIKNQALSALIPLAALTFCASLLYAFLSHSLFSRDHFFIWSYAAYFLIVALVFLITWLRSRYGLLRRFQRAPAQPQVLPPQQMQRRP